MKKHSVLFITALSLLAASCSSAPEKKEASEAPKTTADSLEVEKWYPETDFDTLRGVYTGNFGDGFIKIVLTYVNDKKAVGYDIHKGLQRNITGQVVQYDDRFELTLNEPGDNEYDGIFVLNISKKDGRTNASWTANDPKIASKKFTLKKQDPNKGNDSKSVFDGNELTEDNFMELFSYGNLEGGNVEFIENGIVRYTYYPDEQQNEQQELIKGSWTFTDQTTMVIEWAKNTRFKMRKMSFKLVKDEDGMPAFEGLKGSPSIYPNYY